MKNYNHTSMTGIEYILNPPLGYTEGPAHTNWKKSVHPFLYMWFLFLPNLMIIFTSISIDFLYAFSNISKTTEMLEFSLVKAHSELKKILELFI